VRRGRRGLLPKAFSARLFRVAPAAVSPTFSESTPPLSPFAPEAADAAPGGSRARRGLAALAVLGGPAAGVERFPPPSSGSSDWGKEGRGGGT